MYARTLHTHEEQNVRWHVCTCVGGGSNVSVTGQHMMMPHEASLLGCGGGLFFRSLGFNGSSPMGSTCFPPNVDGPRAGEEGREGGLEEREGWLEGDEGMVRGRGREG